MSSRRRLGLRHQAGRFGPALLRDARMDGPRRRQLAFNTAPSLPNWLEGHEPTLDDDRTLIQPGDAVLLIVEDVQPLPKCCWKARTSRG